MNRLRIPLPICLGKVLNNEKAYKHYRDRKRHVEWEINCLKCGILRQIQNNKSKTFPYCGNLYVGISEI
jgi:hypothetical protein